MRDITYLAMVQLRCDYAGDANDFAMSTLCVQRSDHEATFGNQSAGGFDPMLYSGREATETASLGGNRE